MTLSALVTLLSLLLAALVCVVTTQGVPRCAAFDGGIDMCSYQSHSELLRRMRRLVQRFPHLVQMGELTPRSVEGRPLAYLKISEGVERRHLGEPMFKYVGNMHGDETLGRQLLIYLAEYLLQNYGHDPQVTRLVNTTEIYLMPTMNPDGFSRSKEGCASTGIFAPFFRGDSGRENARGKDLNRDFPKRLRTRPGQSQQSLEQGRQPETIALMRWIQREPFVLSANMHGGAVVASYPFDDNSSGRAVDSPSPDDSFFRFLASVYARNHAFMSNGGRKFPGCTDGPFPGGVTNGADWYVVEGGMQDFNYMSSSAMEITLELSCCKHVPSSTLMQEWLNNKAALLKYIEATHLGVKGLVVDEVGNPIEGAEIVVDGIGKSVFTTGRGEYWRLLTPGASYFVSARANGYEAARPQQVTVPNHVWPPQPLRLDFTLTSRRRRGSGGGGGGSVKFLEK